MADVKGLQALLKNMNNFSAKVQTSISRKSVGKGAAIIRKKAKENALRIDDPKTGRKIADNVAQRYRSSYYKKTGDIMISVGVLYNKGRIPKDNPDTGVGGDTPHWHLVELGTPVAKAEPFLRPAAASSVSQVLDAVTQAYTTNINKELR